VPKAVSCHRTCALLPRPQQGRWCAVAYARSGVRYPAPERQLAYSLSLCSSASSASGYVTATHLDRASGPLLDGHAPGCWALCTSIPPTKAQRCHRQRPGAPPSREAPPATGVRRHGRRAPQAGSDPAVKVPEPGPLGQATPRRRSEARTSVTGGQYGSRVTAQARDGCRTPTAGCRKHTDPGLQGP
jgi:hypothetical protein